MVSRVTRALRNARLGLRVDGYVLPAGESSKTLAHFSEAIDALAEVAVEVNNTVENIGARRLQTVLERVLDDVSYTAPDRSGETVKIDSAYVRGEVEVLAKNTVLSRFFL